jgi:cytochrome b561
MATLRYDPVSQALHWVTAIAVIGAYAMGLIREDLPRGDFRTGLLSLHISFGILVFGLTLLRLAWRALHPAPPALTESAFMRLSASAAHLALYAAMIAVPVVGLFSAWANGRLVSFFWLLPIPSPIAIDKPLAETLGELHEAAAHALMIVAGLHAAAAIGHHLILKDAALLRMLPARLKARLQPGR